MDDESGGHPPVASRHEDADLTAAAVERRLRLLSAVCAAPAAGALAASGAIVWAARRGEAEAWLVSPPAPSFLLALAGLLLVLLSSAARARILRGARPAASGGEDETAGRLAWTAGEDGSAGNLADVRTLGGSPARPVKSTGEAESNDGEEGGDEPCGVAWWLRVYSRATGVSFAMLAAAVALGGIVALRGRAPLYGLVICLVSLLCMAERWPRRSGLEMAMDRANAST